MFFWLPTSVVSAIMDATAPLTNHDQHPPKLYFPERITTVMTRHYRYPLSPAPDEHVHLPLGPRLTKPVATTSHASLAALQWVSDRAGMSYGHFIQTISPSDEARIQEDYERFIAQRESESAKRREGRVAIDGAQSNDTPFPGGFIINDDDV